MRLIASCFQRNSSKLKHYNGVVLKCMRATFATISKSLDAWHCNIFQADNSLTKKLGNSPLELNSYFGTKFIVLYTCRPRAIESHIELLVLVSTVMLPTAI